MQGTPESSPESPWPQPAGRSRVMFLRVSADDLIIYANSGLAEYAGLPKDGIIGAPLDIFRDRLRGEIAECFARPERGRHSNRLVSDESGRVFEARTYSENGVMDVVLNEVTHTDTGLRDLLRATAARAEDLTEDELRTLRHAERRHATVSVTHLRDLPSLAGRLQPHEMQFMLNAFAEESGEGILGAGGTIGQATGDAIAGIFGSPRYHRDHAVRAVLSATIQMHKLADLRAAYSKQGRELPPCSLAVASGEMLLGVVEAGGRQTYTAVGAPVDCAEALVRFARPGEIVLTEMTLRDVLNALPEGWEFLRADTESEPDLSDFTWGAESIEPLPDHLRKVAYLIGPGVQADPNLTELYFDYLYCHRGEGALHPILRVVRPQSIGTEIELDEANVVTTGAARVLGKYRLLELIGEGGMGKVWRAGDRFGNTVAIKVLNAADGVAPAALDRFKREAEIMARLAHRNICRVYEFNEFEGVSYIAMEFVNGLTLSDLLHAGDRGPHPRGNGQESLADLIRSIRSVDSAPEAAQAARPAADTGRILPIEQSLAIIERICDALQFAHEHGVLHRDLKPGNILLREDGEPLVADFGLAKIETADGAASLSLSGHVVGTVENMAPEQALSSKTVDERADVFAIGTILYQLLTGHRFFTATGNLVADAQALQTYTPPRPRALNRRIDPDLEVIVLKALRPERDERYRNAAALKADLTRYRNGEAISARPVTAAEFFWKLIQRNKALAAVTAASIAVLAAGLGIAAWNNNDRRVEAEQARRTAEAATGEAVRQRAGAEQARRLAESRQLAAERALAEAQRARESEQAAIGLHLRSLQKTKEATEEKDEAIEERARIEEIAGEQARRLAETQQSLEHLQREAEQSTGQPDDAALAQARQAMAEADLAYAFQFTPLALAQIETPPDVLDTISGIMERLTFVLSIDPTFVPALMMKARLHLAGLEIAQAKQTLEFATQAAKDRPGVAGADDVAALAALAAGLPAADLEAKLRALESKPNRTAADLLGFLAGHLKSRAAPSALASGFGRELTPGEVGFSLMAANPQGGEITAAKNPGHTWSIEFSGAGRVADLTLLKAAPVSALTIRGAQEIDWRTLATLPLESLALPKCQLTALPVSTANRGLLRVRRLDLSGTPLADLSTIAQLPLLEDLDISFTQVADLSPLRGRKLRSLNVAGLSAGPASVLDWMPLADLVLSPDQLPGIEQAALLRRHRSLRSIRAPGDPEGQTAAQFWKRLDDGAYERAAASPPAGELPVAAPR